MNIMFNRVVSNYLEMYLQESEEELLLFNDPLIIGPNSHKSCYDPFQRYFFWQNTSSQNQDWYSIDTFLQERKKYDCVKKIKNGKNITFWLDLDSPNDILLLWSISHEICLSVQQNKIYIGNYSLVDLQMPHKNLVDTNMIFYFSKLWQLYLSSFNYKYYNSNFCQQISIVSNALQYIFPHFEDNVLYLAGIDIDILDEISNNNRQCNEIVGEICRKKRWVGDSYLFFRLKILEKIVGIIGIDKIPGYSTISYYQKEFCNNILAKGIYDTEIQKKYVYILGNRVCCGCPTSLKRP